MNLDEDFLNAETTVYPCVIDPSVWAVNFLVTVAPMCFNQVDQGIAAVN